MPTVPTNYGSIGWCWADSALLQYNTLVYREESKTEIQNIESIMHKKLQHSLTLSLYRSSPHKKILLLCVKRDEVNKTKRVQNAQRKQKLKKKVQ